MVFCRSLKNIYSILTLVFILIEEGCQRPLIGTASSDKKNVLQNSAGTISCDAARPGSFTFDGIPLPCVDRFGKNYCDTLFEEAEFCRTNCCSTAKPASIRRPSGISVTPDSTWKPATSTRAPTGLERKDENHRETVSEWYKYATHCFMSVTAVLMVLSAYQCWNNRRLQKSGTSTYKNVHPVTASTPHDEDPNIALAHKDNSRNSSTIDEWV